MRHTLCALALVGSALGDESTHRYTQGEEVTLWVNKVGPYHNPQETYLYYSLPFCSTRAVGELEHRWDALGEVLEGNDLISSGMPMRFRESPASDRAKVCSMTLSDESAQQLQFAVRNHYWYQLYLDDLPIWGMVGELASSDGDAEKSPRDSEAAADAVDSTTAEALVYTHKSFVVAYHDDRIIHVNLTSENPVALSAGANVDFTYSVAWVPTDVPFHRRFDRYLDYDFFEHQIHW